MTSPPGERRPTPTLSVCIVTYERPTFLERCLASLAGQEAEIDQVVVVDASTEDHASLVHRLRLDATYVHAPELAGWMTRSRNVALLQARGDILSFLDDDVVLRPGWAANVKAAFAEPGIDAVAGRTCNGVPGEETYTRPIGRFSPDGSMTEGFAAEAPGLVAVDHGIGANMSFRASVLAELGGFRDDYPGTALREDTDVFLRVKALGRTAVFAPQATVDHMPAPHVHGARFDTRYKLYARRNHIVLLARYAGAASPTLWRWVAAQFRALGSVHGTRARIQRFGVTVLGVAWGLLALPERAGLRPWPVPRNDALGVAIRAHLSGIGA